MAIPHYIDTDRKLYRHRYRSFLSAVSKVYAEGPMRVGEPNHQTQFYFPRLWIDHYYKPARLGDDGAVIAYLPQSGRTYVSSSLYFCKEVKWILTARLSVAFVDCPRELT